KCSRRKIFAPDLSGPAPGICISVITNFFSPAALCLVAEPHAPRDYGRCESVPDSLPKGSGKVDALSYTLADFLEPSSWIDPVNHAPQKSQPLGRIVTVSPDVVLRNLGVQSEKAIHVPRLTEDVRRVAKLRGFDHDGLLNIENVLFPKQVDPACPA